MNYQEHIQSEYWKEVSRLVKKRAGYKCQLCNSGIDLHAHHRTYEILGMEKENLSDLTCLCRRCHKLFHGITRTLSAPKEPPPFVYDHEGDMPSGDPIFMDRRLFDAMKTYRGGHTHTTLRALGVHIPLKKNWRRRVLGRWYKRAEIFEAMKGRAALATP